MRRTTPRHSILATRAQFNCNNVVRGLSKDDCNHMANIGFKSQGQNSFSNNNAIWVGTDGPNKFVFTNNANAPVTVVMWHATDYQSSFVNAVPAAITYSLAKQGDSVTISTANGVSGAWSSLVNRQTTLSQYGQVFNTWGEFTSGNFATVDVSREVNMGGNPMGIVVTNNGCQSNMGRCVFQCKSGNSCGEKNTYNLVNCENGSQPGATHGTRDGQPEGGCQGWTNGGTLKITLSK